MLYELFKRLVYVFLAIASIKSIMVCLVHGFSIFSMVTEIVVCFLVVLFMYLQFKKHYTNFMIFLQPIIGSVVILQDEKVLYGNASSIPVKYLSSNFKNIFYAQSTGYLQEQYKDSKFSIYRDQNRCVIGISEIEQPINKYENEIVNFVDKNLCFAIKNDNNTVWKSSVFYENDFLTSKIINDDIQVLFSGKENILLKMNDCLNYGVIIANKNLKIVYYNTYLNKIINTIRINDSLSKIVEAEKISFLFKQRSANTIFTTINGNLFKLNVDFVEDFIAIMLYPFVELPMVGDQSTKQVGEFAITFFHDFINMFMVINIIFDRLLTDNNFDKLDDSFIQITKAKQIIYKMMNMANRILSLKGNTGNNNIVEITSIIEEWVNIFNKIGKAQISFEKTVMKVFVSMNDVSFGQIISNIITNAMDAMAVNVQCVIKISLSVVQIDNPLLDNGYFLMNGEYVKITIEDNGCGMDQSIIDNILSGHSYTNKPQGHGIGLKMVSSLIKENNGLLRVNSVYDKGTTFIIYLPTTTEEKVQKSSTNDLNMIVVEDMEVIRNMCTEWLRSEGYTVFPVKSLSEFYSIVTTNKISIVVLDENIDGKNISEIVNQFKDSNVKFLVTSAIPSTIKNENQIFYCSKPFTKDKFLTAINKVISVI